MSGDGGLEEGRKMFSGTGWNRVSGRIGLSRVVEIDEKPGLNRVLQEKGFFFWVKRQIRSSGLFVKRGGGSSTS